MCTASSSSSCSGGVTPRSLGICQKTFVDGHHGRIVLVVAVVGKGRGVWGAGCLLVVEEEGARVVAVEVQLSIGVVIRFGVEVSVRDLLS